MSRERRRLFPDEEESLAEPGRYGCPMLARARRLPHLTIAPQWRCSLGWALHGEMDAACCQATESATDCWKVHPERKPIVELPILPQDFQEHKASAD